MEQTILSKTFTSGYKFFH